MIISLPLIDHATGVGPAYGTETNYLRVHIANLRRKLEPDPSRPRYLITEAGIGYGFVTGPEEPG